MRHKFYFLIQQITWVVFLFLTLFAVKTFERALPDEIYVPFGEKADYRFGVPVSVTLKDDSEEVFYRLNGQEDAVAEAPFYTVTCKLFGIFPVKDVKVMMVDRQEVTAGGERITVGVLDIDCFKQLNDTYGHIQGDRCLKVVADILKEAVMDCGHVYRFGGDEFVMLFPAGMENRIEEIAEAILQKIAEVGIANEHSVVQPNLTISQGYACFVPEGTESGARLIEHADKALYYVKRNSRNAYYIIRE